MHTLRCRAAELGSTSSALQGRTAVTGCRYAGLKVMLGVDRLDMIKGIPQKLLAFEKFLEDYSEWRDRVVLVQIAVPSRLDVPEYQQLRSQVHEIVGRINGAPPRCPHRSCKPQRTL